MDRNTYHDGTAWLVALCTDGRGSGPARQQIETRGVEAGRLVRNSIGLHANCRDRVRAELQYRYERGVVLEIMTILDLAEPQKDSRRQLKYWSFWLLAALGLPYQPSMFPGVA